AVPRPLGAGLLLQPTGLAALDRLGLAGTALVRGQTIRGIDGKTVLGRGVLAIDYADLDPRLYGVGIHRAALFQILYDAGQAERIALIADCP
ncbi:MAG TPA: FAD-dependent monooxygenase, partial [Hyphomicrobiaceae bacterium]|nr:FAD-dependent monooxygenase [Hyphomicrobiaceae bacterium]